MKTKSSSSRLGPERVPPPITLSHTNQACGPRTILNIIESGYRRWTMPEIRKDYATPTWVVFSAARSQRPGAFRNPKDATPKESCPFCEGHEAMTPPEILASRDRGRLNGPCWSIRCGPNKFPALERVGEVREHRDGPFLSVDGVGAHEIIVESPDHDGHLATLDDRQIERVLRAYRERYHDLAADRRIKYVQIFKNHGERAGASYSHPHSQIIAIPIVPLRILEESEGMRARRAARGRVPVLRNPPARAGLGTARRRRERSVRCPGAVRGALPVRDVAAPESPRACVRDALGSGPRGPRADSERRPRSNVSDARRSVVQLLHSHRPGPRAQGHVPLASRDHAPPHRDRGLRARYRVLHQPSRARRCGGHFERRDPLDRPVHLTKSLNIPRAYPLTRWLTNRQSNWTWTRSSRRWPTRSGGPSSSSSRPVTQPWASSPSRTI